MAAVISAERFFSNDRRYTGGQISATVTFIYLKPTLFVMRGFGFFAIYNFHLIKHGNTPSF